MIRVVVELWPRGDRTRARTLRELVIGNVGGPRAAADCLVKLSKPDTAFVDPSDPRPEEVAATFVVLGHDLRRDVLALVYEAVKAVLRRGGRG